MNTSARDLAILTTSPAGLGHIRVMEALRQGLPLGVRVKVLGVEDAKMQALHRVTSINPYLRRMTEFIQHNPVVEGGFTRWYRGVLQKNPHLLAEEIIKTVRAEPNKPKRVIVVSTHFGSAHQLAAVKQEVEEELGVALVLAVVVTDDSPQQLWAVAGADVIFVPSQSTRSELERILYRLSLAAPKMVVVPYPVSPLLAETLDATDVGRRIEQTKQVQREPFTVMIPISGAAVHLAFYKQFLVMLNQLMPFFGIVVARESKSTSTFLHWCRQFDNVTIYASNNDHEVVRLYEQAYVDHVITAEVTKPSEQAFKVLLKPKARGGVVLLLAEPVGRQEEDNMLFLNRHHLMPDFHNQAKLGQLAQLDQRVIDELLLAAKKMAGYSFAS
jgi:hypothetical protein